MDDKKITDMLKNLKDSMAMHNNRLNHARNIVDQETKQIIGIDGAIEVLENLMKIDKKVLKKTKPKK